MDDLYKIEAPLITTLGGPVEVKSNIFAFEFRSTSYLSALCVCFLPLTKLQLSRLLEANS